MNKDFFKVCFDIVARLEVKNEDQSIAKEVVLDAIEDLQQENKELHNKIDKLSNENQSLRTRIKTIKRLRKHQTQKKNKYKSIVTDFQKALEKKNKKIDKAIDLCNHCDAYTDGDFESMKFQDDIIKILKGDVDE